MFHIIILGAFLLSTAASQIDGVEKYKDIFAFPTMLLKSALLSFAIGLTIADPIPNMSSSSDLTRSSFGYGKDYALDESLSFADLCGQTTQSSLISHIVSSLFGYKTSALSLAASAIGWVMSHSFVIILGAIATYGFCKITGKCSLDYDSYEPLAAFRSFMTKERLDTAEKFLVKAVEKYADNRKRSLNNFK